MKSAFKTAPKVASETTTIAKTASIAVKMVLAVTTVFYAVAAALSGGCGGNESRFAKVSEVDLFVDYTIAIRVSPRDLQKCFKAMFGAAMENPEVTVKIATITQYNNSKAPAVESNTGAFTRYFTEGRFCAQYRFPEDKIRSCAGAADALIKDVEDYNRLGLSGSEFVPMINTLRRFAPEDRRDSPATRPPRRAIFVISELAYQGEHGEFKTLRSAFTSIDPALTAKADALNADSLEAGLSVKSSVPVYVFVPKGATEANQIADSRSKVVANIRAMGYDVRIEDLGDFERISRTVLSD